MAKPLRRAATQPPPHKDPGVRRRRQGHGALARQHSIAGEGWKDCSGTISSSRADAAILQSRVLPLSILKNGILRGRSLLTTLRLRDFQACRLIIRQRINWNILQDTKTENNRELF